MNDNDLNRLSHLLSKQLDLQNDLLILEESKTKVLIDGDIPQLEEIMRQEQSFFLKCDDQLNKYQTFLNEIGLCGVTLRRIVAKYDAQNSFQLSAKLDNLEDILSCLKKTNNVNNKILQSRLSVIVKCLSMIGLKGDTVTYNKDGHF